MLADPDVADLADVIVVADRKVFEDGIRIAGVNLDYRVTEQVDGATLNGGGLVLYERPEFVVKDYTLGQVSRESGKYQLDYPGSGSGACAPVALSMPCALRR